jgi:ribose/xylose/arabinose/galactoside ABC-type transport system permease subunit
MKDSKNINKISWRNWFIYFVLILLIAVFSLLNKSFLSLETFGVIGRQTAMVSLIAFGMTFVITAAQIDLSVGSIVGLVGVISTMALGWGWGLAGASVAGMLTGTAIGYVNGIITTKLKIPSFLVTLGMLGIARGISLTVTGTRTVVVYGDAFPQLWGAGDICGIPVSILWVLLFFIIAIILYNYTVFGNYVKATGGNITAARFSGINTDGRIIKVLTLSGFLSSIAGLLMAARLAAGRPEVGSGMELDAIAAVILGGTSLFGGKGSIVNTLVGALIMGVISHGLVILGLESSIQMIVKGAIIIAAVSMSEKS